MCKRTRKPITGSSFDSHQMNAAELIRAHIAELKYYRPRGFRALAKEGEKIAAALESDKPSDKAYAMQDEWFLESVADLLTEWAQRIDRNAYIYFGRMSAWSGSYGFTYSVESALEDCDIEIDAGDSVPRGFSGMAAFITDHGNVTIQTYSRGRMCREILSVV